MELPLVRAILQEQEVESQTCRGRHEEAEIVCDRNNQHDYCHGVRGKIIMEIAMNRKICII